MTKCPVWHGAGAGKARPVAEDTTTRFESDAGRHLDHQRRREAAHLARLITWRTQVQVLPPLPISRTGDALSPVNRNPGRHGFSLQYGAGCAQHTDFGGMLPTLQPRQSTRSSMDLASIGSPALDSTSIPAAASTREGQRDRGRCAGIDPISKLSGVESRHAQKVTATNVEGDCNPPGPGASVRRSRQEENPNRDLDGKSLAGVATGLSFDSLYTPLHAKCPQSPPAESDCSLPWAGRQLRAWRCSSWRPGFFQ
jgi:hypothetical protein